MVFCFQKNSDLLSEKLKCEAEGREFDEVLRSLLRTIYSNSEMSTIFETECLLTCSWRFLRSNTLKQK